MIHIVGLGGVGFWLAVGLCKHIAPDSITCWDDDTLEGGTGSTRLPVGMPATQKADLLTGYLEMVHGFTTLPLIQTRRFSGLLQCNTGDLVIDCTDMAIEPRKRMWSTARNRGAKLVRVSYDGRGSTVVVSTGLPLSAPAQGGYAAVPSLALSLAAGGIGAECIKRLLDSPKDYFNVALSLEEAMNT